MLYINAQLKDYLRKNARIDENDYIKHIYKNY